MKKLLSIPMGCCELVMGSNGEPKANKLKVRKEVLNYIPSPNKPIEIFMEGSGFSYNGEIYAISKDYVYVRTY